MAKPTSLILSSRRQEELSKSSFGYNAVDELTSVTAPDATVTSYTYDADGNLASRTDAKLHATTYAHDLAGRMTSVTDPLNRSWTHSYDAMGNLTSVLDARGKTITYTYDVAGRLSGINYSDATPDVGYVYDGNGNRTQMTDGAGTETYAFDALNRLTSVTRAADVFTYAYDAAGHLTQRTYPDAATYALIYDDDGRLSSVAGGTSFADQMSAAYVYDAASNLTQTTLGNGYVETRTYDRAARLTEARSVRNAVPFTSYTYTLDQVGNPTTVVSHEGTRTYQYDALDRLTDTCFQSSCPGFVDPFIRYTYDAVGNRLTEARPSGTTSYTYDAADQMLTAGSTSYSYDANGNQTQAGATSYTYDAANRVTGGTGSFPGGFTSLAYAYDGDGKRLTATATGFGVPQKQIRSVWDRNSSLPEIALERDGTGLGIRRYSYGLQRVTMTASSGTPSYYHVDALGSVGGVSDASGNGQWSYSYEPFGTARTTTQLQPVAPENPMRFTGQVLDAVSGQYHMRARDYDTSTGRFNRPDPLAPSAVIPCGSAYGYTSNRPTALVDPSGLTARDSFSANWWDITKEIFSNPWESLKAGWSCFDKGQYLLGLVLLEGDILGLHVLSKGGALALIGEQARHIKNASSPVDIFLAVTTGPKELALVGATLLLPGAGGIYLMFTSFRCK